MNMRRSDELQEALRAIRERHRAIGAPLSLEARLRDAVPPRRPARRWIPLTIAAAAASLGLLYLGIAPRITHPDSRPAAPLASFVMLPASFGLPRPGATSIVRIEIRKGDLRRYGVDVPPPVEDQLVRVDFAVGEDGLARAIRLAGAE